MKNREVLLLLLAVFLVLGSAASLFATGEQEAGELMGTVEFWSYVPLDNPGLYPYIDKFNQAQDKIKIEAKFIPFAELKRQLTVAMAGGTPPDCVLVDNPDYAAYIDMGAFEVLDDQIGRAHV